MTEMKPLARRAPQPARSLKEAPLDPSAGAFPAVRLRRNRMRAWSRRLVAENVLSTGDLIWPMFVCEGRSTRTPVDSMPGIDRISVDLAVAAAREAAALGIPAIALFPYTDPKLRTDDGREAFNPDNLVCRATRAIRKAGVDIGILLDVALDPYTSHGHDGLMVAGEIVNDLTLQALVRQTLVQAEAGCDIIAPSDMMDGRVGAIRKALEADGHCNVQIMAYAAKYASAFYGPFRDAVGSSATLTGDKRTASSYWLDPSDRCACRRSASPTTYRIAERPIERRGILGRIGHDLHVAMAVRLQGLADGADAAIHHVGRRDDVAAGLGLHQGLTHEGLQGDVVDDLAATHQAVVAVAGVGIERDVEQDADVEPGLAIARVARRRGCPD